MPRISKQPGEGMLGEARRTAIVEMLRAAGSVSVAEVQAELGVSPMTARRDLAELARRGIAVRTHGGAVLPSISAHEDSFAARLGERTDAKHSLAEAGATRLRPRDSVFLDSSTTSYFVAQHIIELGLELTLITNCLPLIELVASRAPSSVELVAVGGLLRRLTQSFVGPHAVRTIEAHFADHAFVSVKALAPNGMLADADPLEAEVKRAMIAQASESVLLIDRTKLASRGLNAIVPLAEISLVIAHGMSDSDARLLRSVQVPVHLIGAPFSSAAEPRNQAGVRRSLPDP